MIESESRNRLTHKTSKKLMCCHEALDLREKLQDVDCHQEKAARWDVDINSDSDGIVQADYEDSDLSVKEINNFCV
eukprot:6199781-Pleurochrysis_carterae.AAC.1